MACLENLVILSSLQKFDFLGINYRHDKDGKIKFDRLCRACLPIRLNHNYSGKKQKLLLSLIDSIIHNEDQKEYIISQLLSFFEELDYGNVAWINFFESGFARNLLIKLLSITDRKIQSRVIKLLVDNLEKILNSNGNMESQIEKRNKSFLIQEFFHILALTPCVSLLDHLEKIIQFGTKSVQR